MPGRDRVPAIRGYGSRGLAVIVDENTPLGCGKSSQRARIRRRPLWQKNRPDALGYVGQAARPPRIGSWQNHRVKVGHMPRREAPPPGSWILAPGFFSIDASDHSAEFPWVRDLAGMKNQFKTLRASSLYCQKCKVARPVRERLLLVLPDREIYDYLCTECGSSVGSREVRSAEANRPSLII